MKSGTWLKLSIYLFIAFVILSMLTLFLFALFIPFLENSQNNIPDDTSKIQIFSYSLLATQLITAIGTISSLFIAWRLDRRQAREAALKEKEYALKIVELEHKLAALTPAARTGERADPP
jgi:hypothetical protein